MNHSKTHINTIRGEKRIVFSRW